MRAVSCETAPTIGPRVRVKSDASATVATSFAFGSLRAGLRPACSPEPERAPVGAPRAPPVLEREALPVVRDPPGRGLVPAAAGRGPDRLGERGLNLLVERLLHVG